MNYIQNISSFIYLLPEESTKKMASIFSSVYLLPEMLTETIAEETYKANIVSLDYEYIYALTGLTVRYTLAIAASVAIDRWWGGGIISPGVLGFFIGINVYLTTEPMRKEMANLLYNFMHSADKFISSKIYLSPLNTTDYIVTHVAKILPLDYDDIYFLIQIPVVSIPAYHLLHEVIYQHFMSATAELLGIPMRDIMGCRTALKIVSTTSVAILKTTCSMLNMTYWISKKFVKFTEHVLPYMLMGLMSGNIYFYSIRDEIDSILGSVEPQFVDVFTTILREQIDMNDYRYYIKAALVGSITSVTTYVLVNFKWLWHYIHTMYKQPDTAVTDENVKSYTILYEQDIGSVNIPNLEITSGAIQDDSSMSTFDDYITTKDGELYFIIRDGELYLLVDDYITIKDGELYFIIRDDELYLLVKDNFFTISTEVDNIATKICPKNMAQDHNLMEVCPLKSEHNSTIVGAINEVDT